MHPPPWERSAQTPDARRDMMPEPRWGSELPQRSAFELARAAVGASSGGRWHAFSRRECGAQQYRGGACKGQSEDSATHPGHQQIVTVRRTTSATASFSHRHRENSRSHAAPGPRQNECGLRRAPPHTGGRGRAPAGPWRVSVSALRGAHRAHQPFCSAAAAPQMHTFFLGRAATGRIHKCFAVASRTLRG